MVQLCAIAVALSSPAGMTVAPLGGDEEPCLRIAALPHTWTGGAAGPAAEKWDGSRVEGDSGLAVDERSDVSAIQVRLTTPAMKQVITAQPTALLRGRPTLPGSCANRTA